jgi:inner membrane protein
MDSLSQLALGAAVGVAVMGRRTAVWKAALWGGVAGTLPDLDVLIDRGGPVLNMVLHRGETHALLWQTLFSLPFAAAVARLSGEWGQWRRWWLAMWLALVTHPLLDAMTVYGTQLALPFSNYPYGVGSVFIIDPLYTLPLLVGAVWAVAGRGSPRGLGANALGLAISTAYLAWSFGAQQHVESVARASLASRGIAAERLLVTPTAFNTVLWRVVAMAGDAYHEGYHSLLDPAPQSGQPRMAFDRYPRGNALAAELQGDDSVRRLAAFSHGFFAMRQDGARVLISDLRMGQEPNYTFTFHVADKHSAAEPLPVPLKLGGRGDVGCLLRWLRGRMVDETVPSPVQVCQARAPSLEPAR